MLLVTGSWCFMYLGKIKTVGSLSRTLKPCLSQDNVAIISYKICNLSYFFYFYAELVRRLNISVVSIITLLCSNITPSPLTLGIHCMIWAFDLTPFRDGAISSLVGRRCPVEENHKSIPPKSAHYPSLHLREMAKHNRKKWSLGLEAIEQQERYTVIRV